MDPPIYWNDVQNPVESRGVDFAEPPSNSTPFFDSIHQDTQYLPGSSDMHAMINDGSQKAPHLATAQANAFPLTGILPQDQAHGPANFVPLSIHGSSSSPLTQNLNPSVSFCAHGREDSLLIECPNMYMPSNSDTLMVASSSRGSMQDDGASSDVHFDGRRVSCKRKALEGHAGQSSDVGASTYLQNVECGDLTNAHTASGASMNSAFSPVSDQRSSVHGSSLAEASDSKIPDQTALSSPNNERINYRIRISSVDQGASNPSAVYSIANPIGQYSGTPQLQSAVPIVDHSLGDCSGSNLVHHAVHHMPAVPQSGHSVRWNRGMISRGGGSPNALVPRTREVASIDESNSSRRRRRAPEDPLFFPPSEMGNFVPNLLSGRISAGDASLPRNEASSSRSGSSSSINHSSNAHWDPHYNRLNHYPHRWSEYVRRSLMSSLDTESDGQTSNSHNSRPPAASFQEMMIPSRPSFSGHAFPSRPTMCEGRRWLAAEGRRRLAAEVRNALHVMHRREGLRYEPVFLGTTDMHDRHRDMRLDVDNMSYEELLALEDRIGNVSTGLSEETILARLIQRQHTATATGSNNEIEPCCICQEEFNAGDNLGALECGHDFHRNCITQWLMHKNSCPICKTTGLTT